MELYTMQTEQTHSIHIPDTATKQLAIQSCSAGRKLTVSTNFLVLFGFTAGAEVVEELIAEGKGIVVRLANSNDTKKKKVYTRTYSSRRNNPIETQLDIRSQSLLDRAIPVDVKNVHITFTHGKVTIRPITSRQAKRIQLAKSASDLLSAFVACSSGVDATSLYTEGFRIDSVLEWRPNEKRDGDRDMTETGMVNFISNIPVKNVINEDINNVDVNMIAKLVSQSKTTLFNISLQCDDFSNVKAKSLKEKALEDLSTSSDMVYSALRIIEESHFPFVHLEQVPGFMTSEAYAIMERWASEDGATTFIKLLPTAETMVDLLPASAFTCSLHRLMPHLHGRKKPNDVRRRYGMNISLRHYQDFEMSHTQNRSKMEQFVDGFGLLPRNQITQIAF